MLGGLDSVADKDDRHIRQVDHRLFRRRPEGEVDVVLERQRTLRAADLEGRLVAVLRQTDQLDRKKIALPHRLEPHLLETIGDIGRRAGRTGRPGRTALHVVRRQHLDVGKDALGGDPIRRVSGAADFWGFAHTSDKRDGGEQEGRYGILHGSKSPGWWVPGARKSRELTGPAVDDLREAASFPEPPYSM